MIRDLSSLVKMVGSKHVHTALVHRPFDDVFEDVVRVLAGISSFVSNRTDHEALFLCHKLIFV
jgi:hypothetical protein